MPSGHHGSSRLHWVFTEGSSKLSASPPGPANGPKQSKNSRPRSRYLKQPIHHHTHRPRTSSCLGRVCGKNLLLGEAARKQVGRPQPPSFKHALEHIQHAQGTCLLWEHGNVDGHEGKHAERAQDGMSQRELVWKLVGVALIPLCRGTFMSLASRVCVSMDLH